MLSFLGLAVLVGMHHALEADHLAAVSSLASGSRSLGAMVRHGLTWGLGHSLALFLFAGVAVVLGLAVPPAYATALETAVGVMLVGLGAHVIYRLWRDRVHVHRHRHADGATHFHIHSHAGDDRRHALSLHAHDHRFSWRTLLVGMTHGLAGSAALLLLTVAGAGGVWQGLAYLALFGLGSMLGMALLTVAIGVPLVLTARFLTIANRGLQAAVGIATMAIGAGIVHATAFAVP